MVKWLHDGSRPMVLGLLPAANPIMTDGWMDGWTGLPFPFCVCTVSRWICP
jgi:hypothetical protein